MPTDDCPYTISELAGFFDVSTRTIRFYEEKGLLTPGRTPGNQRIYSNSDRKRLRLILRGKRFGLSLEEIAEIIGFHDGEPDEIEQIQKSLDLGEKKLADIRSRKEELSLMEEDMLAIRENLLKRLNELKNAKENAE